jgi:NAD(P)-dependent dehydrogenase (short-subunit alcohol dehydrogenase family)
VSPAATATSRWESLISQQAASEGKSVDAVRAEAASQYPLKRIATPEDIADLVCFLVSARAPSSPACASRSTAARPAASISNSFVFRST